MPLIFFTDRVHIVWDRQEDQNSTNVSGERNVSGSATCRTAVNAPPAIISSVEIREDHTDLFSVSMADSTPSCPNFMYVTNMAIYIVA